ncbi:hypothetical protein M446_1951 [Methylobacterium sp. 4-46]|uniref:hypothetical protein n=1 Tax=unclassified Methylobacterium TaxID=2615210 RepID=UPI000152DE8C|nr:MULTISPECIES: hypothetical protein [Methylobacterium]ACA16418.1 hypothetical protein M446_1951 [Methylobacterium sp. 4-46]WFT82129.1 hypothetical protein QA634_09905 [Methylobacterium nodulans]
MGNAKVLALPLVGILALGGCYDEKKERAETGAAGTTATNTATTLSKKETGADPVTGPSTASPAEQKARDATTTGSTTAATPPAPTTSAAPVAGRAADQGVAPADGKKH